MDARGGFNGLTWGAGTSLVVRSLAGLGLPPLREADQPRAGLHGSWGSQDLLDERQVEIDLVAIAQTPDDLDAILASIGQAMAPRSDLQPLWLDDSRKLLWVRPRDASWERSYDRMGLSAEVKLRFDALDPLIYAGEESSLRVPVLVSTGGLSVPMSVPMVLGLSNQVGVWDLVNEGTIETWPVITVVGPASNLWLESLTVDRHLQLLISMAATDTRVVDAGARTVLLNGANRSSTLTPQSRWWSLVPGSNLVRVRSDVTAGVVVTWTWRSAWLTI